MLCTAKQQKYKTGSVYSKSAKTNQTILEFTINTADATTQSQVILNKYIPSPCVYPAARVSTARAYSPHMVSTVQGNAECSQHPALMSHLNTYTNISHMYTHHHH